LTVTAIHHQKNSVFERVKLNWKSAQQNELKRILQGEILLIEIKKSDDECYNPVNSPILKFCQSGARAFYT